jgi:hypothetical protein
MQMRLDVNSDASGTAEKNEIGILVLVCTLVGSHAPSHACNMVWWRQWKLQNAVEGGWT